MQQLESALKDSPLGVLRAKNAKSLLVTPSTDEKIPLISHLTVNRVILKARENGVSAPKKFSGKTLSFIHKDSKLKLAALVKGGRVTGIRIPLHKGELFEGDRLAIIRFIHNALTPPALSLKKDLQYFGFQDVEILKNGKIYVPFHPVFVRLFPSVKKINLPSYLTLIPGKTTEIRFLSSSPNKKGDLLVSFETPNERISSATIHQITNYRKYKTSHGFLLREIFKQFKIPGESTSVTKVRKFFKTR